MAHITFKSAQAAVSKVGYWLTRSQYGEYRAAPRNLPPRLAEMRAIYTDSLEDAVGTAYADAARAALFWVQPQQAMRAMAHTAAAFGVWRAGK